jgi:hypothetical protein
MEDSAKKFTQILLAKGKDTDDFLPEVLRTSQIVTLTLAK